MKNPAPFIRTTLVTLLNGVITYEGVQVPCYEGEGELTPFQIILAEQTGIDEDDRHSFNTELEQLIEIVSRQSTNLRKHVDAIGGEVMNLIRPTPTTKGLADGADFQVRHIKVGRPNYITEQEDDGTYINRMLLRITFSLTEK